MDIPNSTYPSYIPDEPFLLTEEEKRKQALAAVALEEAGKRGREITEAGNVPLFTNIQQESRPITTPATAYNPKSDLENPVAVPGGTYQNEVVYVPQKTLQEFNPQGIPRKPPTPQEMTIMDKLVQSRDHVVKNILKYNPMDIDPGRDAMSARDYYLKNNPGDKNGADKAYTAALTDSSARKTAGMQILASMEDAVRQEEMKRMAREQRVPSEMELQIKADQGDVQAKRILAKMMQDKISVAKASGEGRAAAFGERNIRAYYDNKTDTVVSMNANDFNVANKSEPGRFINASASPEQKERLTQATQRGGATTANVTAAVKMYKMEAPELIDLREKVRAKGLLPEESLKDMASVNQWLSRKTNDPDAALLQKKTKFLADSLMRVMGGSQGGEWAFKVAQDILDPSYSPEAFASIVNSHGLAMERMASARQGFGKDTASPYGDKLFGYISTNAGKYNQRSLYEQMKKAGWSDSEIGTAWRKYNGK